MIYVSTACVRHKNIKDSVLELVNNGFFNIELSGGTNYYKSFEDDLVGLKETYNINFRCHNYFPPPVQPFVLNLASLENGIFDKSVQHCLAAIRLSKKLEARKIGFHAGFFINIGCDEIGKQVNKKSVFDRDKAIERFCSGFNLLKNEADGISLYIENNVFSAANRARYQSDNIFMLTSYADFLELKSQIDFNLLLDVAHLKVSAKTLGFDFTEELLNMMQASDYIHISDNDGLSDLNHEVVRESEMYVLLKQCDTQEKDFTLEIYGGMDKIKNTYAVIREIAGD